MAWKAAAWSCCQAGKPLGQRGLQTHSKQRNKDDFYFVSLLR